MTLTVLASFMPTTQPDPFEAPAIEEFFFDPVLPLGINRVVLLCWLASGLLCLFFFLAFRKPKIVPRGLQNVGEMAVLQVREQVVDEVLGEKGQKYAPYLVALFFFIFLGSVFEIVAFINFPITSKIAIPTGLAVITYLVFNFVGIKKKGFGTYLKENVAPPGVPKPVLLLVAPIEFISTFILRPFTLTIRLFANLLAGHLILGFFFSASTYLVSGLFVEGGSPLYAVLALGTIPAGVGFVAFEALIALLQAYIFTLLTAVYIAGAIESEH